MPKIVDEKTLKPIRVKWQHVMQLQAQLAVDSAQLNLLVTEAIMKVGGNPVTDEIDETTGEVRLRKS